HNLYKDLWNELAGMVVIDDPLPVLEAKLKPAADYSAATLDLAEQLEKWSADQSGFLGQFVEGLLPKRGGEHAVVGEGLRRIEMSEAPDSPYVHTRKLHNLGAAHVVLPAVFTAVAPRSIVDVGCGLGSWLKVGQELGAERLLGLDGPWVDRDLLYISK